MNLNGRIALVTGGRIKIGYQTVLKLLRDDAAVVTTTRFPVDAARRFQQEPDFEDWRNRLEIHQLDLRNLTSVETFADAMISSQSHLDILIHNAAQTVKRPLAYYQHLLSTHCDSEATTLIHSHHNPFALLESHPEYKGHIAAIEQYFPTGLLDVHEQQVDLRPMNSWRNKIEDISTIEMLEVYLVNAAAPFILTRRLKTLLRRSPSQRRFIVNVSAMEGQFGRLNKTVFHPHTNMAKAALNMLTRTSAADFAESSIYMNSVDTGWITDEKPTPLADQVRDKHGFYPPLDVIDGAARIYAPIVQGYSEPDEPYCGCFLKDYQPHPW
ncbi:MAG: SDR family oxidoreductase [Planctomycetaceae bacterium]